MTGIFCAVFQQVAVELPDMVFVQVDIFPRPKYQPHHFGITGYFLFVACLKMLDL